MSRPEAWFVHLSTLLVGGTGLVYAWMLYALEPLDPYAVVNHRLQPATQHLHVWLAPLVVFAAGLLWRGHAWRKWKRGVPQRRWTGAGLMAVVTPMTASGYLLQTAVSEGWRTAWLAVHLGTGGLWLLAYAAHLLGPKPENGDGSAGGPRRPSTS